MYFREELEADIGERKDENPLAYDNNKNKYLWLWKDLFTFKLLCLTLLGPLTNHYHCLELGIPWALYKIHQN